MADETTTLSLAGDVVNIASATSPLTTSYVLQVDGISGREIEVFAGALASETPNNQQACSAIRLEIQLYGYDQNDECWHKIAAEEGVGAWSSSPFFGTPIWSCSAEIGDGIVVDTDRYTAVRIIGRVTEKVTINQQTRLAVRHVEVGARSWW